MDKLNSAKPTRLFYPYSLASTNSFNPGNSFHLAGGWVNMALVNDPFERLTCNFPGCEVTEQLEENSISLLNNPKVQLARKSLLLLE